MLSSFLSARACTRMGQHFPFFACEELHLVECRHPIQVIKAKYKLGDCSHMVTE
jgi:hypothetical protein